MAAGTGICWCFDKSVLQSDLDQVPYGATSLACMCQDCLVSARSRTPALEKFLEQIRQCR